MTIRAVCRGSAVEVAVSNRSEGILAAFHNPNFLKSAQANARNSLETGDAGLGVANCMTIVEQLGGRINLKASGAT